MWTSDVPVTTAYSSRRVRRSRAVAAVTAPAETGAPVAAACFSNSSRSPRYSSWARLIPSDEARKGLMRSPVRRDSSSSVPWSRGSAMATESSSPLRSNAMTMCERASSSGMRRSASGFTSVALRSMKRTPHCAARCCSRALRGTCPRWTSAYSSGTRRRAAIERAIWKSCGVTSLRRSTTTSRSSSSVTLKSVDITRSPGASAAVGEPRGLARSAS